MKKWLLGLSVAALIIPALAFSQTTISNLPAAQSVSAATVFPADQNGQTQSVSLGQISSFVGSNNVLSFNARTGAITLLPADVATALGFTPLSVNNPTATGTLSVNGIVLPQTTAVDSAISATRSATGLDLFPSAASVGTNNF
jgi:hypothetical protein